MSVLTHKTFSAMAGLLEAGGRAMRAGGIVRPSLDPDKLIDTARRRTGLDDFGDRDFQEPFRLLTASFDSESDLNLFGRIAARHDLLSILTNRLRMERDRCEKPEIRQAPIHRPLFITGMPRTGTTLLHGLLAQDPASRSPQTWETMYPTLPRRREGNLVRRIERAERKLRWFDRLQPELRRIHPLGARLPQECLVVTAPSFYSYQFQTTHSVPSYQDWLEDQDLIPSYQGHKEFLQHLQWREPGDWWVLKAPAHLFGLPALFSVYPDARVVMTHRNPLPVVASLASLTTALRQAFSEGVDAQAVGPEMTERWSKGLAAALEARDCGRVPSARVVDIQYSNLVKAPIATVQSIYETFDMPFSAAAEKAMRMFLAEHQKDMHGRHEYTLERFGLSADEEKRRYGEYAARFGLDGCRFSK